MKYKAYTDALATAKTLFTENDAANSAITEDRAEITTELSSLEGGGYTRGKVAQITKLRSELKEADREAQRINDDRDSLREQFSEPLLSTQIIAVRDEIMNADKPQQLLATLRDQVASINATVAEYNGYMQQAREDWEEDLAELSPYLTDKLITRTDAAILRLNTQGDYKPEIAEIFRDVKTV